MRMFAVLFLPALHLSVHGIDGTAFSVHRSHYLSKGIVTVQGDALCRVVDYHVIVPQVIGVHRVGVSTGALRSSAVEVIDYEVWNVIVHALFSGVFRFDALLRVCE